VVYSGGVYSVVVYSVVVCSVVVVVVVVVGGGGLSVLKISLPLRSYG